MVPDLTSAKILCDSISQNGTRLITVEATFWRAILAEWGTHRSLSKNASSSRAIPIDKQIQKIMEHPFVPQRWPIAKSGMSADSYYEPGTREAQSAEYFWLAARNAAVNQARSLVDLQGIHKEVVSRLLEPFMYVTVIFSGTEDAWNHVFELRCHPAAQPEFQISAGCVRDAIAASTPQVLEHGQWHIPLIFSSDDELSLPDKIRVSIGRLARVSYLNHQGIRDVEADIALFNRLTQHKPPHLSPTEHVATPNYTWRQQANFHGWMQVRWLIEHYADLPGEQVRSRQLASEIAQG